MDFASLMSSQISKSKSPSTTTTATSTSKYLKKSDIEAQRLADYEASQRQQEEERRAKADKKRKLETEEADRELARSDKRRRLAEESRRIREEDAAAEEAARRKRLGLPDISSLQRPAEDNNDDASSPPLDDAEVTARLRALDEPATLFGETSTARRKRYLRLTALAAAPALSKGPIPTTLQLVPEAEMRVPDAMPAAADKAGHALLCRQLASYFSMVLGEWEDALRWRDDDVKRSTAGKQAHTAMMRAREDMVPLFRRLEASVDPSLQRKAEPLPRAIVEPVVEIVRCCQARRYVDANDAYLRLSIGKAAWPIGVTMVGIHARSAREKLHEKDNAGGHIMSDEVTRKFLQSIKRCLSFAQTRWPPDDQLQLMG